VGFPSWGKEKQGAGTRVRNRVGKRGSRGTLGGKKSLPCSTVIRGRGANLLRFISSFRILGERFSRIRLSKKEGVKASHVSTEG